MAKWEPSRPKIYVKMVASCARHLRKNSGLWHQKIFVEMAAFDSHNDDLHLLSLKRNKGSFVIPLVPKESFAVFYDLGLFLHFYALGLSPENQLFSQRRLYRLHNSLSILFSFASSWIISGTS